MKAEKKPKAYSASCASPTVRPSTPISKKQYEELIDAADLGTAQDGDSVSSTSSVPSRGSAAPGARDHRHLLGKGGIDDCHPRQRHSLSFP
jgi:hypothetical protein